ncbi:MAG TPA: SIS domain-containing protein [bacterium]|nr:SIS domain-containing protein [bacterium]
MKSKIIKEVVEAINDIPESLSDGIINEIRNSSKIFIWGLGRSGIMGRAFAIRLRHLGKEAFFIGEVCPPITKNDLLIVISKTGKSKMLFPPVKAALKTKAMTICITTTKNSLAGLCKKSLILHIPRSGQFGGSLFEQCILIFFDEIVEKYRNRYGVSFKEMAKNHANWE